MAEVASAYVSLLPSAKGFGRKLDSQVGPDLDKAGATGGKRFGASFGKTLTIASAAAIGALAARAAVGFLKDSIAEAREAQKVGALTANVIKTTGGAANVTAKQVGKLATAISNKTGVDDEAIQSGSNLLLTFKNVANAGKGQAAIFDRATAAAVDLSASGFGDLAGASKQLGKALNDPVKGISALGRAGVTFTDAQKKQIKGFVAAGDVLSAQKIILKEVESQVGGAAAASATSGEKLSVAFGNLKEQIGTALLPVIDKLAVILTEKVVPAVAQFTTYVQKNPKILYAVAGALGALVVGLAAAFIAANVVVVAIAALVAGLIYAYTKFPQFAAAVNAAFAFVKSVVAAAIPFIVSYIKGIVTVVQGVVNVIKGILNGDWSLIWQGVKQIVSGAITAVKAILSGYLAATRAIFTALVGVIRRLAASAFAGLVSAATAGASKVLSLVKSLPGRIKSGLGNLGSLLLNAGKQLIQGLINGIASKFGAVKSKLGSLTGKLTSWKGPESLDKVILKNSGQLVIDGFITGLESRYPRVQSTLGDLTGGLANSVNVPAGARLDASSANRVSPTSSPVLDERALAGALAVALDGMQFDLNADNRYLKTRVRQG